MPIQRTAVAAMLLMAGAVGMTARAQAAKATGTGSATGTESATSPAGSWQGTLEVGSSGGKAQRIVVQVSREGDPAHSVWKGVVYNLDGDQPYEGRNTTQMSVEGGMVRFAIAPIEVSFEGKLSADGQSIAGRWTQGGLERGSQANVLNLARAEGDTAWAIPDEDKAMAKDADPDWEVVTVRLGDPDGHNSGFHLNGRQAFIERQSVDTMLLFGYGMQKKQLVNAPDWLATERWDVKGLPDVPGKPSVKQYQSMTRKVLVERFGLVTHTEQREMDVYALTVGKGGPKMEKSAGDPNGHPDEDDNDNGAERTMRMENATMGELSLLLKFFMDRPVVDQTGLMGRYDLQLKWTFDETRAPADGSAAPSIFTAIQEQLGLKLEPVKAMTDVMVIDKVERPGPN